VTRDGAAATDPGPGFDHGKRADGDVFTQFGPRVYESGGMNVQEEEG